MVLDGWINRWLAVWLDGSKKGTDNREISARRKRRIAFNWSEQNRTHFRISSSRASITVTVIIRNTYAIHYYGMV